MRASPDEIGRQIERQMNETPDDEVQDFGSLEQRAASDARPYGRIAIISLAALALAGAGYLVYRRINRPALAKRLRTRVMDSIRDLPPELQSRLKKEIPRVKVLMGGRGSGRLGTRVVF